MFSIVGGGVSDVVIAFIHPHCCY